MRYASEDLRSEHEGILHGLKILEALSGRLADNGKVPENDVRDIVDFFRLFADRCHHGKEEGFFFPALQKAGVANENGPIGQMLAEHAAGRTHIARMAEAAAPGAVRADAFVRAAADYRELLRPHIDKENNVLFPMGDRLIPLPEQSRLLEDFEKHEAEVMGPGTHERLHAMLATFDRKYLGDA